MKTQTEKKLPSDAFFAKGLSLAKSYFLDSEERYVAWLLLIGAILSVIALVFIMSALSTWGVGFWAALEAKDLPLFIASLEVFAYTVGCYTGISVLKNFLVDLLGIRWRNWLTETLLNQYVFGDNNYLDLMRLSKQIENPGQRIQEDIQSVVDLTLSLSLSFLDSTFTLVTFIGSLWVLGGTLSVVVFGASLTIPGYLVWTAILFAGTSSFITQKIGKTLTGITQNQTNLEADFRKDLELLKNESESIAQEHGEPYYKKSLNDTFKKITDNAYQKLLVNTGLIAFQSFYMQLSDFLPYIIAAPLYFSGFTSLGELMPIAFSFGQVQIALSWFIGSYESIAVYQASVGRLIELENALKKDGLQATVKRSFSKKIAIKILCTSMISILHIQPAAPASCTI